VKRACEASLRRLGVEHIEAQDDWRRHHPRFEGENFKRNLHLAETVRQIAEEIGCTPAQLALAWVLGQGKLGQNPALAQTNAVPGLELQGGFTYKLNIFQVNPRLQMLANNASSDAVPFTLFEYSDVALHAPPLAEGLTCLDLVRMTLDRYLTGAKGYGQVGYGCTPTDADLIPWKTPWTSLDTLPSLLISACNYANGARDWNWARANYDKLLAWARQMMAADKHSNGLIEYPGTGNFGDRPLTGRRPSNWWDTINFGHEDAFANALAYRAATMFADLECDMPARRQDPMQFTEHQCHRLLPILQLLRNRHPDRGGIDADEPAPEPVVRGIIDDVQERRRRHHQGDASGRNFRGGRRVPGQQPCPVPYARQDSARFLAAVR